VTAEDVIRILGLVPLPEEGGFYRETYRADLALPEGVLPTRFAGPRAAATSIFYLVTPVSFSGLHRLKGDEQFHYYMGDPVEMLQLHPDGTGSIVVLGTDLEAGMTPQHLVPGGTWQGTRLVPGGRWALLGTTMTPGFDFADFESGRRQPLSEAFPEFADRIHALTRE